MCDLLLLKNNRGFTLIEMVVVLALVALLLAVTLPRLAVNPFSDTKRQTTLWIANKIQQLKEQSLRGARSHTLHIDIDAGHLWSTHAGMRADEIDHARQGGYTLPEGARIEYVEFPQSAPQTAGEAEIMFFEKGHSQMALIQARFANTSRRAFLIEPFLPRVKIYEEPLQINQ